MPTVSTPLFRLPPAERRAVALELIGHAVEVEVRPLRTADASLDRAYVGELLSVASVELGSGTDVAVIRPLGQADGRGDRGFSLAQVASIRSLAGPRYTR